jgi:MFS family permease
MAAGFLRLACCDEHMGLRELLWRLLVLPISALHQGDLADFAIVQTYYASILPEPNSTISWIGSTQACLLFVVGIFSGRAFDAGWFRPTVLLGIAIQILGIFTMSAAKNYWQLLLTQGICTGIGGGIFFMPVMGLVATYFAKRRGLAVGLVTVGNSVGGMIYPTVVRQLLPMVGFGWTVRVLGFINVACLTVVIAFTKPRLPPRTSGPLWDKDSFKDVPYILFVLGVCFLMPAVYFVFYYVSADFGIAHIGCDPADTLAGCFVRARRARHALYPISQPRHHPQRRRPPLSHSPWLYRRPLPWTT